MEDVVDKVKELTTKLDKGVEEILTSDRYRDYLKQMSKFHNYSFRNTLLILLQNENATLVAGYKTWQTQFNRQVNKGEKGIQIFAPCPYKIKKEREITNEKGEKEKKVEEVIRRLKGIDCRGKGTSCPDQIARALESMNN